MNSITERKNRIEKAKAVKMRRYRLFLITLPAFFLFALFYYIYHSIDSRIPSEILLQEGSRGDFSLNVPATGEIVSAGMQNKSNIPEGAVVIDLNEPVRFRTAMSNEYKMQVKLFGFWSFKEVGIHVVKPRELIPVGVPVGIYMESEGVLVVGVGDFKGANGQELSPAKNILRSGDYIKKENGVLLKDKEALINAVESCSGKALVLEVERNGETFQCKITPKKDAGGTYRLGAWVRDNTQGVGTMTYIDSNGNFGALGHGINDVDTSGLLNIHDGTLYKTEIVAIRKGENGTPGEMTGMIVYSDTNILGDVLYNGPEGVFGKCNEKALRMIREKPLPVGYKQEVRKGKAQILCEIGGEKAYYDVEITAVHLNNDNVNRGIELKVTDERLIEKTGGIVQGMSGSPIIQDGKIVGAVTHVLINDPARGYGIFIEKMLEH